MDQPWVHVATGEEDSSEDSGGGCCGLGLLAGFSAPVQQEVASSACKIELHSVLNAFQHGGEYGVHVCESFRDPRLHHMDDYWDEVACEALSIQELHSLVGGGTKPLSDAARARLHQFSRLLERLSKRIDRVVLAVPSS
jgi:hypothetical protein